MLLWLSQVWSADPRPAKTWLSPVLLAASSLACKLCAAPLQDIVAELCSTIWGNSLPGIQQFIVCLCASLFEGQEVGCSPWQSIRENIMQKLLTWETSNAVWIRPLEKIALPAISVPYIVFHALNNFESYQRRDTEFVWNEVSLTLLNHINHSSSSTFPLNLGFN